MTFNKYCKNTMKKSPKLLLSNNLQAVAGQKELYFLTCSKNFKRKLNKIKNFTKKISPKAKLLKISRNLPSLSAEFSKNKPLKSDLTKVVNLKPTLIYFQWILNF